MNNRNNALDDRIKQERLAYQKRVRRLREQARKEEERLALRTAEIIRTKHPDSYSKYEEEARRLLEEERLARSSRAKRSAQSDAQPEVATAEQDQQDGGTNYEY